MPNVQFDDTILGESNISFKVDEENFMHLYIGTFDALMRHAIPMVDGYWDAFALRYHMHDGFYDEANWVVPSVSDYLLCVRNIAIPKHDIEVNNIKAKMVALFEYALKNGKDVVIDYF